MDRRLKGISQLKAAHNQSVKDFTDYLKDKTIDVLVRWEAYIKYLDYLPSASYFTGNVGFFELHHLELARESYHTFGDICDTIEEALYLNEDHEFSYTFSEELFEIVKKQGFEYNREMDYEEVNERLDKFVNENILEYVLQRGEKGFTYDW